MYRDWQADRAVHQARAFLEKREIRSGLLSVRTALRHRPDHLEAHKVAAELMEAFGSPEALIHRRRLVELQPELPEAKLDYARSALRCRNSPLAAKILANLDGSSPETPEPAAQTRDADAATMQYEEIDSLELMERAARAFACWFENKFPPSEHVYIFCGPGNNGGDGLAVARILSQRQYHVKVFIVGDAQTTSPDHTVNLQRIPETINLHPILTSTDLPHLHPETCVIDALFRNRIKQACNRLIC